MPYYFISFLWFIYFTWIYIIFFFNLSVALLITHAQGFNQWLSLWNKQMKGMKEKRYYQSILKFLKSHFWPWLRSSQPLSNPLTPPSTSNPSNDLRLLYFLSSGEAREKFPSHPVSGRLIMYNGSSMAELRLHFY